MAVDFRALLKDTSATVSRPKPIPECWLTAKIGAVNFGTTKGNETPFASFELLNPSAHDDTSEEVMEVLKEMDLKTIKSPFRKTLAVDFWLTDDAKHHLADMLDRVIGDPERSFEERIPETRGVDVMFKVRPNKDQEGKETAQVQVDGRTVATI